MNNREHKKIQKLRVKVETRLNRLCWGLQIMGVMVAISAFGWDRLMSQGGGRGPLQWIGVGLGLGLWALGKWAL